jgi:hypothetical protein
MSGTGGGNSAAAGGGGGEEALNFRALQAEMSAARLRIMADLGLTESPPIKLARIRRSKTSSSERVRREALIKANRDARVASAAARAAAGGKTRKVNRLKKFFEDSARHLGDSSIATPAHLEVGAVLAPQEGPGAYITPEERRRVTRSQKKKKTTSASWF